MIPAAGQALDMDGYRRMAVSVLHDAALRVVGAVRCSKMQRLRAYVFLSTPSPLLEFWCDLAGVRMSVVIAQTRSGQLNPPRPGCKESSHVAA